MKKICAIWLCLCLLLALAGCIRKEPEFTNPSPGPSLPPSQTQETTAATEPETTQGVPSYRAPLCAASLPITQETATASDGALLYRYLYQNIFLLLQEPGVADRVVLDFLNRVDSTRSAAESVLAAAQKDYYLAEQWTPYLFQVLYSPTRIDQGVLSLFGSQESYSGSPHPSHLSLSVTYDLITGNVLTLPDILAEGNDLPETLEVLVCQALEPQAGSLYPNYREVVRDRFSVDLATVTNWYFSGGGLCFYFSPYDLAPYAAGTVVAEIPYETLAGLMKDDFFPPERETSSGSFSALAFEDADRSQLSQYAELVLDGEAPRYLLLPEGLVYDVRILQSVQNAQEAAVVFGAEQLGTGDAIMLQAVFSDQQPLYLSYRSGDQEYRVRIVLESGGIVLKPE